MHHEVRRLRFATDDIDVAHATMRRIYVDHGMRLRRPSADDFEYHQAAVRVGPIMVGHLRHSLDVELDVEPLTDLLFVAVAGGRLEARAGRQALRAVVGDVLVNPIGHRMTNTVERADVHTLTLDRALVAEAASARTGMAPADFRFATMAPVSPAMARHWRDTMAYLRRLFAGPDEPLENALVIRAVAELAAATALAVFPNTATTAAYLPGPGRAAPASVGRALAHMDEHAGAPITIADLAAAARVTPRALQAAFRRHLGYPPMAHLRRVRLDRAHRDLRNADPTRGDTVAAIAHRWGWASMSRFATDYRATYGNPPSHTLRA